MESEKETAEASNKQEGEDGSTEFEEKVSMKDDGGCVEADKLEEEEEIDEAKQENEEMKEEKAKEEEEDEKAEEEEDDGEERENTETEKKNSRKKRKIETAELSSPRTPASDRPTRERKTVERFTVNELARNSTPKPLAIHKGEGTQLKDIANVAFKLSKRKADENLHLLHTILFGKKAKVHNLKKNIGLFSGFVWIENEEKQRAKVKEKLDKCVKEKLLDFCDVLNIPVNKATIKKEELSAKLLEFLKSPHATSDILLAEKEKGKKRKSNDSAIKSPGSKSIKKQKSDSESVKKRKHSSEEENDDKSEPSQSEDDDRIETDDSENESGEETSEEPDKDSGKKTPAKASNTPSSSTKKSSSSISKKGAANSESKIKPKAISTKKQKAEKKSEVEPTKAKSASKSSTKVLKKDQGEGKSSKKAKKEPTREEMHTVVVNILKEVDFNTATLSDILRQLGNHFGVDLLHRKSEVKDIITEAIKNMSDDEDEESSESGGDGGDNEA